MMELATIITSKEEKHPRNMYLSVTETMVVPNELDRCVQRFFHKPSGRHRSQKKFVDYSFIGI